MVNISVSLSVVLFLQSPSHFSHPRPSCTEGPADGESSGLCA